MTIPTIRPDATIARAYLLMKLKGFRRLKVVLQDEHLGWIRWDDVLRALRSQEAPVGGHIVKNYMSSE